MDTRHSAAWWQRPLPRWTEVVLLLFILALASWFRLYQLGQVPPGPHYDEAAAGLDALDVLDGNHMVFSPRSYGREMLFVYVAAPLVALLGPTLQALRLPIALVGIVTVLVTYLLVREVFCEDKRQAQWIALLASLFLALSFWHLVLNHLSFRANYLPLTEVLCFLFLWRAMRTGHTSDYLIAGFFLGLNLYTYTAARFVPVVVAVFFVGLLLTRRGRALVLPRWRRWALVPLVALLVSAPLLLFFLSLPEQLLLRAREVSIFNPDLHQGDFWGLVGRSVLGNLALFGFRGDPNWLYNIPGRPGLDPVQALLFWLGAVLCLVRWRQPRYLFLLVWWLVMLLPSILAPDPIPHSLRAIGTLPVACILSARALVELFSRLLRTHRLRFAAPLVLLLALPLYLTWTGYNTWHSYFDTWLPRDEVYYAYYGHMADLAEQINGDAGPETVYIFPVNYDRRGETYQEYPLELLHRGPVPFRYIVVDDTTVARDLTDICAGKDRIQLVVWTHGDHIDADPRQVLPFLLTRFGQEVEERAFRGYRIITYELPSTAVNFAVLPDFAATSANFGDKLDLVAQAHSPATASGEVAWVALRWQTRQVMDQDYKISLRLVDAQGHLVGQVDAGLLSNEHQTTSHWTPGQVETTYHRLPSLPATLPGTYSLHLTLYDPDTQRPIGLADNAGIFLGEQLVLGHLEIGRPWRQRVVQPEVTMDTTRLAHGLELRGYDLDRALYSPGETIRLALYWHALEQIADDNAVILQLVGRDGQVAAEWIEEPAYPTARWQADDFWRDWHDLRIAPDTASGEYQLVVALVAQEADERTLAALTDIEVQGRPRLFEVPDIGYPQVAQLGEEFRLLGYDLPEKQIRAGQALRLTLYWQAVQESQASYTVFAHLLDADARIWGQKDSLPGGGALPTTSWLTGEVITDHYEITIEPDTPRGEYLLEVGMYLASTGERLLISDRAGILLGDHVVLDTPVVVMP